MMYVNQETGKSYHEDEVKSMYDDCLDDCYGMVEIAGSKCNTSKALKLCDPIAYRVGFTDWLDSMGFEDA